MTTHSVDVGGATASTRGSKHDRNRAVLSGQRFSPPDAVAPLAYASSVATDLTDGTHPTFWTNASVTAFAGDDDPVEAVTTRAREVVFSAVQTGWTGPPFDPIALARHLG